MRNLALFSYASLATLSLSTSAIASPALEDLAQERQWRSMLHYDQIGVLRQSGSQIEDASFFLAADGQYSALAELKATVAAMTRQPVGDVNESAQCRYPARLAWLQEHLPETQFESVDCPEFDEWRQQLNAEKVFLVFPAAYLNSPSSMYGHTLFRLKKKGNDTPLLDFAVNYAANTDPADNQLVFSYKGLSGGYPGVVSVMPFYQKVKEYNFLENRDIWEYELDLTSEEVDQFVRHIWEMKRTSMPYYFFSQNCSYQLLTMLDAASPRLNLAAQFDIWAIPADTVREIKRQGVLGEASYRPSTLNKIENMLAQVSPEQIAIARELVEQPELDLAAVAPLTPVEQARVYDVAYEYSRYLSARKKSTLAHLSGRSIKLLSLRSKLQVDDVFAPVTTPSVRDDQGHSTSRISLGGERRLGENYTILDYRPSYHDVLDPKGGYLEGAELSMFSGALRWSEQDGLEIDQINFLNIHSMAPANALMLPKSWHINASLLRDIALDDELVFRLHGGAGVTQRIGDNSLLAGFWNGRASLDDEYKDGYQLATGPEIKWLASFEQINLSLSYQYLEDVNRHDGERQEAQFGVAHTFAQDWQWRLEAGHTKVSEDEWSHVKGMVNYYF
ncbi:DUF4105 domain-containing protein [Marinomonas ostreistagni]|uniref:Lnb N-terminal periplasmic domain-containing protein n=1 Tax=Marinomonas ostreistagni TaxID=359209 RepID=UPI00194E8EAC|nr:DUF4105 domain-containing protein [Marinomonas ostreistagni]MBM6549566.1 DUF4105 domain-containing protein [Marinomonas ostreistagni]